MGLEEDGQVAAVWAADHLSDLPPGEEEYMSEPLAHASTSLSPHIVPMYTLPPSCCSQDVSHLDIVNNAPAEVGGLIGLAETQTNMMTAHTNSVGDAKPLQTAVLQQIHSVLAGAQGKLVNWEGLKALVPVGAMMHN